MDKLYDYIASKYDSSYIYKIYGFSLRKFLDYGVDYHYIDDINILKMFHDIYLDVRDKFDDYNLEEIKKVHDKYLFLMNRIDEYKKYGNYNRDNFFINHESYVDNECINYVRQNASMFSLNELFDSNHSDSFGGVCLISKIQTVCIYNDDSFGYIGSGYHNDSFHRIIKAIYNEKFEDGSGLKFNDSGQDIKVSISNGSSGIPLVFVDIPVPINSSQFDSLKILNNELKKFNEKELSVSITNFYDENYFLEFDNCFNLEDVFKWVIVSDSYIPFFEDKNIVGFLNGENHFNNGYKKNGKQK